jgi:hypothetical protein
MSDVSSLQDIHLEILKITTTELGELCSELVFLGGATISLYITEPHFVKIRETLDVDCIVEVTHRQDYEKIAGRLRSKGFCEDIGSSILCRFRKGSLILDVMPTDSSILGFTNIWYREGFRNSIIFNIGTNELRVLDLPYLIASKIEAFKGRGKGIFLYSHDIEDIVTLFDGRSDIVSDLNRSSFRVREYLIRELGIINSSPNFVDSLDAHISDRLNLSGRKAVVLQRLNNFLKIHKI